MCLFVYSPLVARMQCIYTVDPRGLPDGCEQIADGRPGKRGWPYFQFTATRKTTYVDPRVVRDGRNHVHLPMGRPVPTLETLLRAERQRWEQHQLNMVQQHGVNAAGEYESFPEGSREGYAKCVLPMVSVLHLSDKSCSWLLSLDPLN